jgi:hypothetical protein
MSDSRRQWQKELEPTVDCIAIERLGDERTDRETAHLAACPRCQAELALFAEFNADSASPDEAREGQWIAAELHRRLDPQSLSPSSNVKQFRPRTRTFGALATAAAAVIVIGTGWWMNREPSLDPDLGRPGVYRTSRIEVIAPTGEMQETPRELKWVAVAGATSYDVQILEVDRTLLWSSQTPRQTITLPAEVVVRFTPGKALLWEVTARRGAEVLASSGTQRFRVSMNNGRSNP